MGHIPQLVLATIGDVEIECDWPLLKEALQLGKARAITHYWEACARSDQDSQDHYRATIAEIDDWLGAIDVYAVFCDEEDEED